MPTIPNNKEGLSETSGPKNPPAASIQDLRGRSSTTNGVDFQMSQRIAFRLDFFLRQQVVINNAKRRAHLSLQLKRRKHFQILCRSPITLHLVGRKHY